ncbi:aminoglycoside phosphotransferase family protein [Nocardioides sp. dk4132]|nr:aminoglycoside phosphotransferase family protein [Nocardioides sp. dk4132]QGA09651.1 aminoglycoside phosphotransferase family protein [Nocardioides sp. dk884]
MSGQQADLLAEWLPGWRLVRDLGWGLVGTTVLQVEHDGGPYVVKAGDAADHHLARELRAHREWLTPWTSRGRAPVLVHGDEAAKLLVTRYLPGELVQGNPAESDPDTYEQAGWLLRLLHDQLSVVDEGFEARERDKALAWLARSHRIEPAAAAALHEMVSGWPTPPTRLVPTHGDWQPRNWLIDGATVRAIDLGRADLRPAMSDLTRLAAQQFRVVPGAESAFLTGYGTDPRDADAWFRTRVREAIGTAVWAHQVGDEPFEAQGHRMVAEVLAEAGNHPPDNRRYRT